MEFDSAYELGNHYSNLQRELPYPEQYFLPPQPTKKDFPNNQSFGKALDEWEEIEQQEKEKFVQKKKQWSISVSQIEDNFKTALLKYLGIFDNKKAEKLFSIAWERGHSSGYGEVAQVAEELAELIKG